MPGSWLSWRRTLSCKSDKDAVYDPRQQQHRSSRRVLPTPVQLPLQEDSNKTHSHKQSSSSHTPYYSSCKCSSLQDIVHGNTRVVHRPSSSQSPNSNKDSSDFLHEVSQDALFLEECSPPEPEAPLLRVSNVRKKIGGSCGGCDVLETMDSMVNVKDSGNILSRNCNFPQLSCQRCGDCFSRVDALEYHHTLQHAVSELGRGDSSRNIIEIIFRSSWITVTSSTIGRIERVLKINNTPRTISRFEDYRDCVKNKANATSKKNPRCIADGNELLRFYGTSVLCSLGENGSTSVCSLTHCGICKIIRMGFSVKANKGICTTATSSRAHVEAGNKGKRAMVVCRVIAGRCYRASACSSNGLNEVSGPPPNGYDSIVSGIGSDGGDLVMFNPRALLPCFVVIYK